MDTVASEVGAKVATGNVPVFCPSAMVRDDGTVATSKLPLLRFTTAPPAGAAAISVIVPVEDCPLLTGFGLRTSDWIAPGIHLPLLPAS